MPVRRNRMLWYYDAIIDWMIANPGKPLYECAAHVHKSPITIGQIVNSDMFKAALAQRKAQFQAQHDIGIIERTTKIATASLDAILAHIERKKDTIPLETLKDVSDSALNRLGYGAKPLGGPGVQVNVHGTANVVAVPVSQHDLEEARMALRQYQSQRPAPQIEADRGPPLLEAELVTSEEETSLAPVIPPA